MAPKPKAKAKPKAQGKGRKKKNESQSYLADDENFQKFSEQLAKIGLELRDITGDGNCCFRALSDQMNGDESLHEDYRKRVCQYMRQNKDEFEPFVAALIADEEEDTNSNNNNNNNEHAPAKTRQATKRLVQELSKLDAFEKYIRNLEQAGTYADNGCLVAFARLFNVDINIHQLNLDIWTIHGSDMAHQSNGRDGLHRKELLRQLHLSYHNGEHYSSIRPIGDKSTKPSNINISETEKKNNHTCTKSKQVINVLEKNISFVDLHNAESEKNPIPSSRIPGFGKIFAFGDCL